MKWFKEYNLEDIKYIKLHFESGLEMKIKHINEIREYSATMYFNGTLISKNHDIGVFIAFKNGDQSAFIMFRD